MVDQAKLIIMAGKGGDGAISFRREKFVPKGGPDGGDGGKGGSVYAVTDTNETTLRNFSYMQKFEAPSGQKGAGRKMSGLRGDDVEIKIPMGTVLHLKRIEMDPNVDKQVVIKGMSKGMMGTLISQKMIEREDEYTIDFDKPGMRLLIAKGGKGGAGNVHFKSSTNTTPRHAVAGQPGEAFVVEMELKMLADIGLVGLPNAGKSTLLSMLTKAKPKIADYAFTTIEPNMGVLQFKDRNMVIADIPGLIEGASEGKGLGIQFLKHVERTKVLLHVIGASESPEDLYADYKTIRNELKSYNKEMLNKKSIVVLNKIDLINEELVKKIVQYFKTKKVAVMPISCGTGEGIEELKNKLIV